MAMFTFVWAQRGLTLPSQIYFSCKILSRAYLQNVFRRDYTNIREVKRFYKNATIATADGWYEVNLDKRKLRTPTGNMFRVPNEALALAVATEWNSQGAVVKKHAMHLTILCNIAIDNPLKKTRDKLIESIVRVLDTDTLCYRMQEPPELQRLQWQSWEPVLDWARDRYGIQIQSTYNILPSVVSRETANIIGHHLKAYSEWALLGYQYAVEAMKSLLLVMAVMDKHVTVEQAVELATLEQIFQCSRWGNVEWHHGIDQWELRSRLAAAVLFVNWTSESSTIQQKASLNVT